MNVTHTTTSKTIEGVSHASCSCGWSRQESGLGAGGAVFMAEQHERAMASLKPADQWCTFIECIHHLKVAAQLLELAGAAAPVAEAKPSRKRRAAQAPVNSSDPIATAIAGLTPAGKEFMAAVGMKRFDFFDEGIVEGSGNWGENMSWQFASMTDRKPRSVSGVMSRLSTVGLWDVYLDGERTSDGNWWSLTELGANVAQRLAELEGAK